MLKIVSNLCLLLPLFSSLLLTGCAVKPPVAELPEGYRLTPVATASGSPLAWHPDSSQFAAGGNGLFVVQVGVRPVRIYDVPPAAVAWSPTGSLLAAAFGSADVTRVLIFDSADWQLIAESEVAGVATDLAWRSDDDLLIAAVELKKYRFGGNYILKLHHWQQNRPLATDVLFDTTPLLSHIAMIENSLAATVNLQISPYRDEILYTRLAMTPNAGIGLRLMLRHLTSGQEKELTRLPMKSGGGRYLGGGKQVFYSDGVYQSIVRPLWDSGAYDHYPAGYRLEISPGGRYMLIDSSLYADRTDLLSFDRLEQAKFSPDGSRLLVVANGKLYLLEGMADAPFQLPSVTHKLLEMRRWLSEGLITPQEFERYLRKKETD